MDDLRLWDWIVLDCVRFQVIAIEGAVVELEDSRTLCRERVPATELVSFASVPDRQASLGGVAAFARASVSERERCERIAQVITAADAEGGSEATVVMRTRESLARVGHSLSDRQVRRYRTAFHAHGVAGLLDHRRDGAARAARTDPRVLVLIETELDQQQNASTGTRSRVIQRVEWKADELGISLPSRSKPKGSHRLRSSCSATATTANTSP